MTSDFQGRIGTGAEAAERLRFYFAEKSQIKLVLIYGSAAKGTFGKLSDIDIAIAGDRPLDREQLYAISSELTLAFGREIDIIDLNRVEGLILFRVMTEGKRIKTDSALFVKFRAKALGYREDFKPLQDMIRKARIRRFISGY